MAPLRATEKAQGALDEVREHAFGHRVVVAGKIGLGHALLGEDDAFGVREVNAERVGGQHPANREFVAIDGHGFPLRRGT